MPWDMRKRVETEFLDDFDGEVVKAGFVEGLVSAERSRSGRPVETQQLFLLWKVLDQEVKEQPAWYSMGGRATFTFGGKVDKITIGTTTLELHEKVIDGPELKRNSRAGLLLERLKELEWEPVEETPDECANAKEAFVGLQCHLKREKYEPGTRSTLDVERETLMPTTVIGKAMAPAVVQAEEVEEVLLPLIIGKTEAEVAEISKMARMKAIELSALKIFKLLDKMVADGRLVKRNGIYHKV